MLDGEVVAQGPIEALGDPGERLRWLAELVGGLHAGDVVFLGSPAAAVDAVPGRIEVHGPGGSRFTGSLQAERSVVSS